MRLYLIPLTRTRNFIYCQQLNAATNTQKSRLDRATTWFAKKWLEWENGNKTWQVKLTSYGNKAISRIPYQEWGLKSIPPLSAVRRPSELSATSPKIPLLYPPFLLSPSKVLAIAAQLAAERKPFHRRWFLWSLVAMPVSAPFALVPVVPNIPFFYAAFRAYSHWKALAGANHLEALGEKGLLAPEESGALDLIYKREKLQEEGKAEELLIDAPMAKEIASALEMPALAGELERCVAQVQRVVTLEQHQRDAQRAETEKVKHAEGIIEEKKEEQKR